VVLTAGSSTPTLKVWRFDETGVITFPDNTVQTTAYTGSTSTLVNGTYTVALSTTGQLNLPGAANAESNNARIQSTNSIDILSNLAIWTFGTDGNLTLPGDLVTPGNIQVGTTSTRGQVTIVGNSTATLGMYNTTVDVGAQIYLGDSNFNNSTKWNSAPGVGATYDDNFGGLAGALGLYTYAGNDNSRSLQVTVRANRLGVRIHSTSTANGSLTAGALVVAGGATIDKDLYVNGDIVSLDNLSITANTSTWTFGQDGKLTLPNSTNIAIPAGAPRTGAIAITSSTELLIGTNTTTTNSLWTFGIDGSTVFPENTVKGYCFTATNTVFNYIPQRAQFMYTDSPILRLISTIGGVWYIKGPGLVGWKPITGLVDNSGVALLVDIAVAGDGSEFHSGGYLPNSPDLVYTISQYLDLDLKAADKTWTFSENGSLTFPDATIQTTAFTGGGAVSNTGTTSTFVISNTATSNSTNTGALQVTGGVGIGGGVFVGGNVTATSITALASTATVNSTAASVGYMGLPQNATSSTTLTISDAGKHIYVTTSSQTITIPAASSVPYPIGTAITFIAGPSATTVTIAITSDTMRLAGAGTTGSRTLAAHGMATAVKVSGVSSAGVWYINGVGLT
jgi:hypothetical protein